MVTAAALAVAAAVRRHSRTALEWGPAAAAAAAETRPSRNTAATTGSSKTSLTSQTGSDERSLRR